MFGTRFREVLELLADERQKDDHRTARVGLVFEHVELARLAIATVVAFDQVGDRREADVVRARPSLGRE